MYALWESDHRSILKDMLVLLLLFGVLFTFLLGHRPLATPDEGRYVEIPREMLEHQDFVTPRLNGLKYFEKPPLFYWMQALSIHVFGLKEFTLRLWTTFLGLCGVLMTYAVGRFGLGRLGGFWSACVLGTSLLYVILSRLIILDLPLSIFLTGAFFTFWLSTQYEGGKKLLCSLGWGTFLALSVLTKGLVGVVLPGGAVLLWILFTRQWFLLGRAFHPAAIFIFLAISVPWHVLAQLQNPDFFDFYFIHEHFLRYTTTVHHRYQPVWFFIPVLLLGFFPWVGFLGSRFFVKPWTVEHDREKSLLTLCACWAISFFVFFSFSSSKLIPYLLPIFPALALGAGAFLAHSIRAPLVFFERFKRATWFYIIFSLILGLGIAAYVPIDTLFFHRKEAPLALWGSCFVMALVIWGSALLAWLNLRKSHVVGVLKSIFIGTFVGWLVLMYADPYLQPRVSIKPLAIYLKTFLNPQDKVISYGTYYQDLPVYLNQTVQVFGAIGELEFGANQEPWKNQVLKEGDLEKLWQSSERVFLITKYEKVPSLEAEPLWRSGPYNLFSNQPLPKE